MWDVLNRKIFYGISAAMVGVAVVALLVWGLPLGIDFKGGTLIEASYASSTPASADVLSALEPLNLGAASVRSAGDRGYFLRFRALSGTERPAVVAALSANHPDISLVKFDSIGPILGKEAAKKSLVSISFVLIAIIFFIAFAFRKVSEPVSSWKYGVIAVIALLHDVIIPTGVFAVLGHFAGIEVDSLFVTAILVVLGFSVHDTIVVFDRTREHLRKLAESRQKQPFLEVVGQSVSETFVRSINTSFTTALSLVALVVVGPEATRWFSVALLIGIVVGTYSSIFIASNLLVTVEAWQRRVTKGK